MPDMTSDRVKAVLNRVLTWPKELQEELAKVALEIEAEMGADEYEATPDELEAIDEGLLGDAAKEEEVNEVFAIFRRA
jgi:hypothetical protein